MLGCLEPFGSWCDAESEDGLSWGRLNPKAGKRSQTCGLFFFFFLAEKNYFGEVCWQTEVARPSCAERGSSIFASSLLLKGQSGFAGSKSCPEGGCCLYGLG